jgi:copper chaperone CopZ
MKKKFRLENLGCANCAEKMCAGIMKIDGVEECGINFIAQKMTLVAADEAFDAIVEAAQAVVSKYEPDCKIVR